MFGPSLKLSSPSLKFLTPHLPFFTYQLTLPRRIPGLPVSTVSLFPQPFSPTPWLTPMCPSFRTRLITGLAPQL